MTRVLRWFVLAPFVAGCISWTPMPPLSPPAEAQRCDPAAIDVGEFNSDGTIVPDTAGPMPATIRKFLDEQHRWNAALDRETRVLSKELGVPGGSFVEVSLSLRAQVLELAAAGCKARYSSAAPAEYTLECVRPLDSAREKNRARIEDVVRRRFPGIFAIATEAAPHLEEVGHWAFLHRGNECAVELLAGLSLANVWRTAQDAATGGTPRNPCIEGALDVCELRCASQEPEACWLLADAYTTGGLYLLTGMFLTAPNPVRGREYLARAAALYEAKCSAGGAGEACMLAERLRSVQP